MIIQTIGLEPSVAIWTEDAGNVSRLNPSGADQADAEHPTRNPVPLFEVMAVRKTSLRRGS
jgi:hypothetical protein